jgi:hypothetical protein
MLPSKEGQLPIGDDELAVFLLHVWEVPVMAQEHWLYCLRVFLISSK